MKHGLFVGDLDEIDFIETIEERFGIAFKEADYSAWHTLGDIHTSLAAHLGPIESPDGKCATQMAFYRLRKAAGLANAKARPDMRLDALGLGNPRKTIRAFKQCGLKSPSAWGGIAVMLGGLAIVGAAIALFIAALSGNAGLGRWTMLVLVAGGVAMWLAPSRYPPGITTLGALAKHVARMNPMILKAHGAGLRPGDVWESLRAMASDETGIPAEEIFTDTPFIQRKVKRCGG